MALQNVNLGTTVGDGTGDGGRDGGVKINANFSEIYSALGNGTALASGIVPFTSAEQLKLSGVENNAKDDQTASEIASLYESFADVQRFTTALQTKLSGVQTGATDDQTGTEIAALYEAVAGVNRFTDALLNKLNGIAPGATDDQTGPEIKALYESEANTNALTDSLLNKLISIDANHYLQPVQDLAALAALSESSLSDKARVYVEDETSDYFYNLQAGSGDVAPTDQTGGTGWWVKLVTSALNAAQVKALYESNADTNPFTDTLLGKLNGVEVGATGDQTGAEIAALYEGLGNVNRFTDALLSKLTSVEDNATADQTALEISTLYEGLSDVNRFTDALLAKLNGIAAGATANSSDALLLNRANHTGQQPASSIDSGGGAFNPALISEASVTQHEAALDVLNMVNAPAEAGATADQSGADIKALYEAEPNTNPLTDALAAKLASIDANHYLAPVQDVTALAALSESTLTDKARTYVEDESADYFYNVQAASGDVAPTDQVGGTGWWIKLATGGDTAAQVKSKYESNPDTNALTDALLSKLNGVQAGATDDLTGAEIRTLLDSLLGGSDWRTRGFTRVPANASATVGTANMRMYASAVSANITLTLSANATNGTVLLFTPKGTGTVSLEPESGGLLNGVTTPVPLLANKLYLAAVGFDGGGSTSEWTMIDMGASSAVLDNKTATSDPTVNDDSNAGYEVLSRWVNTTTNVIFGCADDSPGAAVWRQLTEIAENPATVSLDLADGILVRDASNNNEYSVVPPSDVLSARVDTEAGASVTITSADLYLTKRLTSGTGTNTINAGTFASPGEWVELYNASGADQTITLANGVTCNGVASTGSSTFTLPSRRSLVVRANAADDCDVSADVS